MSAVLENKDLPMVIEQGVVGQVSSSSLILDASNMQQIIEFGKFMAAGRSTIPNHLAGNAADCAAVATQAMQWRMNPWAVAQKTHTVNGVLGYEAQLVNAVIQSSGVTDDRFHYEWYGPWEKIIGKTKVITVPAKGDKKEYQFRVPDYGMEDEAGLGIKIWATLKGETEPRVLDLLLVQASVRNSPLWASDPKQQLAYLAVKRWTRLYAPDVILGVYTPDELEEFTPRAPKDMGNAEVTVDLRKKWLAKVNEAKGADELKTVWQSGLIEIKPTNDMSLYGDFKAAVEARGKTFKAATVEPNTQPASVPPELEGLIADLEAGADGGIDSFVSMWDSLSAATQDKIKELNLYAGLKARSEKAESAK